MQMGVRTATYRYGVDAADLILWADERWLAFAMENGAPELTLDSIIGRSLWDFVSGDGTRRLFEEIHARVRQDGKPAIVPFRCDSPTLQRHMRMKIVRGEAGELIYESVLLRVEPQRHLKVLDAVSARSDGTLTMCSCCKRALLEPVGWLDVEDVSIKLRFFDTPEVPNLRYDICPECTQSIRKSSNGDSAA
jgi:hypothetical protein